MCVTNSLGIHEGRALEDSCCLPWLHNGTSNQSSVIKREKREVGVGGKIEVRRRWKERKTAER